ncbi:NAD-dependent epimerase/dehydratase family protein [Cohnella faecalis]|uniref:NAD-dependent epimerase/dehydratase family protein n=1 Tax=Cohnella faecalis TaxID=2315694 RepID=A0A398CIW5_9BACL|nr:NAD-dependent epimerase/dehydratase family protein [Cohnella faecalis]RIE02325.1 NAD-dependent epimerase/dehydratase family protein [Cohnella faecalis]
MRILIIGGTGFIGPYVVKELHEEGHTLAMFNRGHAPLELSDVTVIQGDIESLADYKSEFQRFAPDVVVHMIAYTERDAHTAVSLFAGIAKRIVVLSSMDVYRAYGIVIGLEDAPPLPIPLDEQSPLRERLYPYGGDYEKILVERVMLNQAALLPATVLRLPMVYGPGDPSHRLYKYVKRKLDNRSVLVLDEGFAHWRASRGYVENVAHAIAVAAVSPVTGNRVYNVGEEDAHTEKEWAHAIARTLMWEVEVYTAAKSELPSELANRLLRTEQDWITNTSLIRKELGYKEIVAPEAALLATVQWEAANPPAALHPKDYPLLNYEDEDSFLSNCLK